jgi:hypothetical protein
LCLPMPYTSPSHPPPFPSCFPPAPCLAASHCCGHPRPAAGPGQGQLAAARCALPCRASPTAPLLVSRAHSALLPAVPPRRAPVCTLHCIIACCAASTLSVTQPTADQ